MLKVLFINQIRVENVSLLIITELLTAKLSITLCSDVVVALLPVLGLKLEPALGLVARCSTVLNFAFNWIKKG